jgi:hypothetical protein
MRPTRGTNVPAGGAEAAPASEVGPSRGGGSGADEAAVASDRSEGAVVAGKHGGRRGSREAVSGRGRRRSTPERLLVRVIGTGGIVGLGVALGAILASSNVQGWIIGLVVALVTVILSAILWSSNQF